MPLAALLLCTVVGISDGDTLTARCDTQTITVRLAEIDAPERHQSFGNRSKQALAALCFKHAATVQPIRTPAHLRRASTDARQSDTNLARRTVANDDLKVGPRLDCPRCAGSFEPGWVCAEHQDKPWKHDGCGWEGLPCAVCNPDGVVMWKAVYATTDPECDKPRRTR